MAFGRHSLDLPKHGRLELRDGVLYAYWDAGHEPLCRVLVGPDGLTVDGGELSILQKGDPPKLRLGVRGNERNVGYVSMNWVREDGKMEEVAFFGGALADDAAIGELRGQLSANVRLDAGNNGEAEPVWVATSAYSADRWGVRRLWTGSRNWVGWLWKFARGGDDGPLAGAAPSEPSSFLRSPGGQFELELQVDGNFVVYDEHGGHVAKFDVFSLMGRLADLTARIEALEQADSRAVA